MRQWFSILPPRMVSRKWTCQLSSGHTLPSAAAMPPSAITVCALPRSDLQTMRGAHALAGGLDGGPEAGPAGADHDDVVLVDLVLRERLTGLTSLLTVIGRPSACAPVRRRCGGPG